MSFFSSLMSSFGYVAKADAVVITAGAVTSQIAKAIAPLVAPEHQASVLAIATAAANDTSAVHAAAAPMAALGQIMASQPNATASSVLATVAPVLSVIPSVAPWINLLQLIARLAPVTQAVAQQVASTPTVPVNSSGGDA